MFFTILCWICLSVTFCVTVHYIIISLNSVYAIKKIKYLGVFENEKYQEIINELKKNEVVQEHHKHKQFIEPQLSEEMEDMKNSLIEIMRNSI